MQALGVVALALTVATIILIVVYLVLSVEARWLLICALVLQCCVLTLSVAQALTASRSRASAEPGSKCLSAAEQERWAASLESRAPPLTDAESAEIEGRSSEENMEELERLLNEANR